MSIYLNKGKEMRRQLNAALSFTEACISHKFLNIIVI
jgi:hypothetical protein